MPEAFSPRFAAEAAFLILLAVGLGLADLRAWIVVAVMGGAWLLVCLLEWAAWRSRVVHVWTAPLPEEEPEPPAAATSWDMREILVPEEEQAPPEPEQAGEALTSVVSSEEPEPSERPPRRWRRRRPE